MPLAQTSLLLAALCVLGSQVRAAEPAGDVTALRKRLDAIEQQLKALPELIPHAQAQQRLGFHGLKADPAWVRLDFGKTVTPERIVLFPARLPAPGKVPSEGFPPSFQIEIAGTDDFATSVRLAEWAEPTPGAGEQAPFLSFTGNGAAGRFLRVRITSFRTNPHEPAQPYFRLGEIVVLEKGHNAALGCRVDCTDGVISSRAWEPRNMVDGYFWCLPLRGREASPANGYQSTVSARANVNGQTWVEVDLGAAQPLDEVHLVPAHPRGLADLPGYGFPPRFLVLGDADSPEEKLIHNETKRPYPLPADGKIPTPDPLSVLPNPGAVQIMVSTPGLIARRVRVSCDSLWRRGPASGADPSEYVFALGELQCWREGKNIAAGRPVLASSSAADAGWSPAALTDGHSSRHELLDWTTWLNGIEQAETLRTEALAVRAQIQRLGELRARRVTTAAIASAIAIALIAAVFLLIQPVKARRQQEALRTRIARDLHDEIGASLSHLAMQGDLARQQLQRAELSPERLEKISASARETLDQMRDIIWLLTPKEGDWQELSHRMEGIARRLLDGVGHQVTHHGEPPDGRAPIEYTRDILAFLKEALTNARKHARATEVRVRFDWSGPLVVTIEDDGQGFDVKAARNRGGSGLENLQARAAAMQASCDIQSTLGKGTVIRLSSPLVRP